MSDEQQAETADAPDAEEEVEATESGIQDGDFVKLDYTVRTKDDETVVDTTKKDVAEEAGIDDDDYEFAPRVIVVGAGHVFPGVDEDLIGKDVGDSGTVDIPAEEAFGEFDSDDVKTVAADKIAEDDRYPGAQVQIDGEQGRLETIIGGRARVDFNHPLAGEDLEYDYEIVEIVDDREEQAQGLLGMYLQQSPEVWIDTDEVEEEQLVESDDEDGEDEIETVIVEKETLYIEATPQMTMNQQWMFSKQQIAQDVIQRLGVDRVIVQETIDGSGGMMGGMGGMMGGAGGAGAGDIEDALDDVDIDADEIVDELDETEE
ncbi:FKBP-type peptidyl-prolyl cis-trans isomerase SlyD [Halogranum gelatinilyticum]|uniref:Peptidyl-prolyl cis-trans isomerase n=1 Tax=Halogranum gelatinilyticum TaxID=660521 RepID=A0A1G9WBX1_9EURY|nr:peptidylprolyl isomerase [Halogranum gelatinilyticum]SDM81970.1 FKBP-type peptidyl-prolyl cis-trans isomerase SlyD [Halogranum gelatinilyticum]